MIERLIEEIEKKKAPIVVGLDPDLSFLPMHLVNKNMAATGNNLKSIASAILEYNMALIDAISDLVPAVKPQIAMYEQFGIPGIMTYRHTIDYAKEKGLIVIGDVKRGDIGSTSTAYARAHIGSISLGNARIYPFGEDMCTVNPYLGDDGITPFINVCKYEDKGIFVLVKTSNPGSGQLQDLIVSDGRPVYEHVASMVSELGEELIHDGYSDVGAVVGATYPEMGARLRELMPHTFILVPGYGAQGATGKDLKGFFDKDGRGAIVNSSRGIIAAYKNEKYSKFGSEKFDEAARAAVLDMIEDINYAIH